jgi:hypothetical protein
MVSWASVKGALETTKHHLSRIQPTITIQPIKLGIRGLARLKNENDVVHLNDLEPKSQQPESLCLPRSQTLEDFLGMARAENLHAPDGGDSDGVEHDLNIATKGVLHHPDAVDIHDDGDAWCGLWFLWGVVRKSISRHLWV